MKIQTLVSSLKLICLGFFMMLFSDADAQRATYGNGDIQQNKRIVKQFTSLNIQLNGIIHVHLGEQPHVIVETDENIISMVRTEVNSSGILTIDQDGWPEPSKKFIVHVFTPYLTKIEGDSWSDVFVAKIDQEYLTINKDLGTMKIEGKVNDLFVESKQCKMDFSKLIVKNAKIKLSVRAKLTLCCAETVEKDLDESSRFKLLSDPDVIANEAKESKRTKLVYVSFSLVNNSYTRKHFVVRGPYDAPFSYGFALMPYFAKKERWPVGTKIYRERLSGSEELLQEIKLTDADSQVKLFND